MKNENLESLLLEESKVVYKYLIKIGASKEDTEDIIQETLYKTIKNIDSINENKIRAWLFKLAINSYYNIYKNKKKYSSIDSDIIQLQIKSVESAEEKFTVKENKEEVNKVLQKLKPSYKNLLIFKYYLNLSYKEIADIMEISEEKVKVYLYRARKKFKEIWKGFYNEQK